ncbi:MAG: hypothetical protein M0R17_05860 [Candidatus Omnitrophica bacterium]|jgi:hypothetical protein|nr:hypothetical protein [Candidatus Omnitrophota bacterium]
MGTEELIKEIKNNKEKKNRKGLVITLSIIIVILLGICVYIFLVKPYLNNLISNTAQLVVYSMMQEVSQCNELPITLNNQTITFIAKECLK